MDYSVGSLSDLITGSNTPNKKKVIKKQLSPHKNVEVELNFEKLSDNPISSNKKKKVKKNKIVNEVENLEQKKTPKKRNIISSDESEPVGKKLKKSNNNENAERRINGKNKIEEDPELLERTVFVGNIPLTSDTKKLKKIFSKYGKVDTVRIRGAPVADPKTPKKVAIIKKEFHPERKSFYAFIRFENSEDAVKATEANGTLYKEHHLRVHLCGGGEKPDENKAIFVGNLSFYAEEDDLWKIFEPCGAISSVRIIRDTKTGMGKGFGYVNFQNSDSVTLALEMENVTLKDRELRIKICNISAAKKNNKDKKVKKGKSQTHRNKALNETQNEQSVAKQEEDVSDKKEVKGSFHGVKFVAKKKKKLNKGLLQKKKLVKKIAPK